MKNLQKGFVVPIVIAIVAVLAIGGGAYFYSKDKVATSVSVDTNTLVTTAKPTTTPEAQKNPPKNVITPTTPPKDSGIKTITMTDDNSVKGLGLQIVSPGSVQWGDYVQFRYDDLKYQNSLYFMFDKKLVDNYNRQNFVDYFRHANVTVKFPEFSTPTTEATYQTPNGIRDNVATNFGFSNGKLTGEITIPIEELWVRDIRPDCQRVNSVMDGGSTVGSNDISLGCGHASIPYNKVVKVKFNLTVQQQFHPDVSDACVASQTAKFAEVGEYVKGNVLVSFKGNVSFETAKSVLSNHGYSYKDISANSYSRLHGLTAIVPEGGEIAASCYLLSNGNISSAVPNGITHPNN